MKELKSKFEFKKNKMFDQLVKKEEGRFKTRKAKVEE